MVTPRRGLALPAALVLVVVLAAIAARALAHAAAAAREARLTGAVARAGAAADAALAVTLQEWDAAWTMSLAPGAWRTHVVTSAAGAATVHLAWLDDERWLLAARAAQPAGTVGGRAARRVALLARLPHLALDPGAALVSGAAPWLAGGATLDRGDAGPPEWTDCMGAADPRDAARLPPGVAPAGDGTVVGPVREDPGTLDEPTYRRFGEGDWGMLAARADVRVDAGGALAPLPAATGGACAPGAWGEPWRGAGAVGACTGRLPVIHVRGAGQTTLRAPARWQGVLLVDGDLVVEGQVEGVGLVVVQGRVDATAGALLLHGALLARAGVALGPGSRVVRSRCALERAARAAGKPIAYGRRAWLDVTP